MDTPWMSSEASEELTSDPEENSGGPRGVCVCRGGAWRPPTLWCMSGAPCIDSVKFPLENTHILQKRSPTFMKADCDFEHNFQHFGEPVGDP